MKTEKGVRGVFVLIVVMMVVLVGWAAGTAKDARSAEFFATGGASFVENKGQWADESVRFALRGKGGNIFVTNDAIVIELRGAEPSSANWGFGLGDGAIMMRLVGANKVAAEGIEPSETAMNYFRGSRERWRSNVATYNGVAYRGLYDGIDLFVWGKRERLKLEFHVAPGADWRKIAVAYDGIDSLSIDSSGRLIIATPAGDIVDEAPQIYQEINGRHVALPGRFYLRDKATCGFEVTGACDSVHSLVIDPELVWATYLGGGGYEWNVSGIAIDRLGNVYAAGETESGDFPMSSGWQGWLRGESDAFVSKFSAEGDLLWSSYLGGSLSDGASGIAADGSENVYVAGHTYSTDFPTSNALHASLGGYSGCSDAFVSRLSADGQHLFWSTYLGGRWGDGAGGVALGPLDRVYVTGGTWSDDFPTTNAWEATYRGGLSDVFVSQFTADGQLVWSSYLGGGGNDYGYAIAVDKSGSAYVTGVTSSGDFPMPNGWDTVYNGGDHDVFVSKFSSDGQHLLWSTYLGGRRADEGGDISVDETSGNVYVTGTTGSYEFPVLNGWDTAFNGGDFDAFASKFSADGQLLWSTYLGGSGNDKGGGVAVDERSGNVYVTGYTDSLVNFPIVRASKAGSVTYPDAFVTTYAADGQRIVWSICFGGSSGDWGEGVAVDEAGGVYITGLTDSADFPTPNGWDTTYNGGFDVFVAKFAEVPWQVVSDFTENCSDWTTGTAAVVFTAPEFLCDVGYLRIFCANNTNTFGYWHSPIGAILVEPAFIYRASFNVVTDITDWSRVPQIRLRANSVSPQQSDYLTIESASDGAASPIPEGRDYDLYFAQSAMHTAVTLAFDVLNFDPLDAASAEVALHRVVVDRFARDALSSPTVVRNYTFDLTTEGWTTDTASVAFAPPIYSHAAGALVLRASNNINTFGCWRSDASDITVEANRVYRGTCEVRTDIADRNRVPQMRLRFNTANLQASRTLGIESIGDGSNSPGTTNTIYDNLCFLPPQNCVGDGLIVSFDMLNFSPDDASTGSLILHRATVEALLPPASP
jgi:hypothetical protein